ncbi:hypothetical protein [Chryseobacterium binzhouense]|uniref:hypothetical protein n=1 Tax=Chryseobacterium binzhouense TaxID=2593646 RepID=UPI00289652D7|nr:hypothetical protein [Chryseobacterium binzhouense]
MKKKFLLLFCFVSSVVFSQEYHFDYFIKEKSKIIKPQKTEEWFNDWFTNSMTGNEIFLRNYNNKTIAVIYSRNENIKHIFRLSKIKNNINFFYKHSGKIVNNFQPKNDYKGKEIIKIRKIDSLKYNVVVYKNSKLKKKEIDALINFEEADFEHIKLSFDHLIADNVEKELRKLLNPKLKFIIKKIDYSYKSGVTFSKSIDTIQKVNLVLKVPTKPIFKETDYWSDFE